MGKVSALEKEHYPRLAKVKENKEIILADIRRCIIDTESILDVFSRIEALFPKSLWERILRRELPAKIFFKQLRACLRILEHKIDPLKPGGGNFKRIEDSLGVSFRRLKDILVWALSKKGAIGSGAILIDKKSKLEKKLSAADPFDAFDIVRGHFSEAGIKEPPGKTIAINIDLTRHTEFIARNLIRHRANEKFADLYKTGTFQYAISKRKMKSEAMLRHLDFFWHVHFRVIYFQFAVFDCRTGFVMNLANHARNTGRGKGKTLISERNCPVRGNTITDGKLREVLEFDFNSDTFWVTVYPSLASSKRKKIKQSIFKIFPGVFAEEDPPKEAGELGWALEGGKEFYSLIDLDPKESVEYKGRRIIIEYLVVNHLTPGSIF